MLYHAMALCKIFDLRHSMDAVKTTVSLTQDFLKTGRRFFARSSPMQPRADSGARHLPTTCSSSNLWSGYAEPLLHLTQNVSYLAQQVPEYYEVSRPSMLMRMHRLVEDTNFVDSSTQDRMSSCLNCLCVVQSCSFAMKLGIVISEAHHSRHSLAAINSALSSRCDADEPMLWPDSELTKYNKLEHALEQASVEYGNVMDRLSQVRS